MSKELVLVLGANGFIGSHLVDRLVKDGYSVRAFGRFKDKISFNISPDVEIFNGEFLNQNDLEQSLEGVSRVVHLVSTTNPSVSDKEPLIDLNTNVEGSVAFFQKCVENGKINQIIFTSSGGTVYGDSYPGRPYSETDQTNPVSPYGIGKLAIENYLHYFNKTHNLNYTVLRIANPYGGRQKNTKHQGIIPLIINNIAKGLPITVYGDGTMVRDYIHIDDLIDIITKSLSRDLKYNTYNVGSGVGVSVNELVELVEEIVGRKAIIEHREQPATFAQTSILDNSRIKNDINDLNSTSLYDGLKNLYTEYLNQLNS